jgi:hypothetical protein
MMDDTIEEEEEEGHHSTDYLHPNTFVTERTVVKDVYFKHNLAKKARTGKAVFSRLQALL